MSCSISGFYSIATVSEYTSVRDDRFKEILRQAENRGRDSWGVVTVDRKGNVYNYRGVGRISTWLDSNVEDVFLQPETSIAIANCRAEPTTEFIKGKTMDDVQPFQVGNWIISHNGTIANDKELLKELDVKPTTRIDSIVIAELLNRYVPERVTTKQMELILSKLVGSFALAMVNITEPRVLWLANNYKPIFLERHFVESCVYFSSLEEFLSTYDFNRWVNQNQNLIEVPPYSLVKISTESVGPFAVPRIDVTSLRKTPNKKALVICSGGLDSVTAAKLMSDKGYDVTMLHFMYKCRAESKEVEAIKKISERTKWPYVFINTDIFKNVIGHSPLTGTGDINKTGAGEAGTEFAFEWVPARNLIFLSIAVGYAEAFEFDTIVLGNNLEEAGAYPDNEQIFVQKLNKVLAHAVNVNRQVTLEMPVGHLMKHEIVKLALEINSPALDLGWSCYEANEIQCGECGPDQMRRMGFKMNNVIDPLPYNKLPNDFWKGCVSINEYRKNK